MGVQADLGLGLSRVSLVRGFQHLTSGTNTDDEGVFLNRLADVVGPVGTVETAVTD
jgi:hypothetical protein